LVFTFLFALGTTVKAADVSGTWTGAVNNNWSNTGNWSAYPEGTGTATIGDSGNVLLDSSQSVGIVLLTNATVGGAVLNITTGANLDIHKNSSELFGLARTAGSTGTVNHSAGTVTVSRVDGGGTGETRLNNIAGATGTYNLSGTGILDTEVLSKGNSSRAGVWNATGGTLVIRNRIYRFGTIGNGYGFNQGDCTLEIGAINTVKAIELGNSTNMDDYTVDAGGTMVFDVLSASSYDTILQYGSIANTLGAALVIRTAGYTPTVGSFFDVWTSVGKTGAGSGAFGSITAGWAAAWVDTDGGGTGSLDTLRLTYIPEPATIALFGLGLLALRRNKK
jgi:hypothetical protein